MAACRIVEKNVVENALGYGVRRVLRSERLTIGCRQAPEDGCINVRNM